LINNISGQGIVIIMIVAILVAICALVMTVVLFVRMNEFKKAYISIQTFISGESLENLLKANLNEVAELNKKLKGHSSRLDQIETKLRKSVDSAELIRFNSFESMGAELSFSLALLNQEATGVLLTGIHTVEECRLYARAVDKGQTPTKLSAEEKQAVDKACNKIIRV